MKRRRARMMLAIRALRVTYADAARTLQREAPDQLPKARRKALDMLEHVAVAFEPEADPELLRQIENTRRVILGAVRQ